MPNYSGQHPGRSQDRLISRIAGFGKQHQSDQKKRELLVEIEKLVEYKRSRLDEDYLKEYKPHKKQDLFHRSPAMIRLFLGGNQCGKSRAGYSEDVAFALGYRPWDGSKACTTPAKILVVGPDFKNHHSMITLPYLRRMIPASTIQSVARGNQGEVTSFTLKNGSMIKLMSYEQHLKKAMGQVSPFEGHMWDLVHFDEPPPYGVYTACHRGIIARGGRMIFTLTPLACPWLFDKLYMRAGNINDDGDETIFAEHVEIHDNPYLPEEWKQSFLASLSPDEREAREFGKFRHLIGLVYKGYSPDVHRLPRQGIEIMAHWPKGHVVDPHDRRPCAMGWFAVTPDRDIIFFEEWPKTPFHDYKSSPIRSIDAYAKLIREIESGFPGGSESVKYRIMDPNFGRSGKLGMVNESVVTAFAKHRLFFTTHIKDSVKEGHLSVSRRLDYDREEDISFVNKPKLYFTDDLFNFNYGMSHYIWEERRKEGVALSEKPSEEFKDFPDIVRYTCVYNPPYIDLRELESASKSREGRRMLSMANSGLG